MASTKSNRSRVVARLLAEGWTNEGGGSHDMFVKPGMDVIRADLEAVKAMAAGASPAAILLVRATGKPVRANLSLNEGVVSAIDAAARERGVTRSAMVEILDREHLAELA